LKTHVESDIDSVRGPKRAERRDKPLVWLRGEIKTPPFSKTARVEAGLLLRQLQLGETLSLPQSRPMPAIGARCHELRIMDAGHSWRIVYRTATTKRSVGEESDEAIEEKASGG
jgi:phage-related protein